ncbi:hypothetical protein [Bacillus sp. JJ1562]|uniref:hypothetical protein n=1 Tax=Bacillus sp. JJ1562 TaxID=3122960 RepID=UPI00300250F8
MFINLTKRELLVSQLEEKGNKEIGGVDLAACSDRELSYKLALVQFREVDTAKAKNVWF